MPKELRLVLRDTPIGLESTPNQAVQQEKFAQVAKKCSEEFKDSKLKGAAKVLAMNRFMSDHLRG